MWVRDKEGKKAINLDLCESIYVESMERSTYLCFVTNHGKYSFKVKNYETGEIIIAQLLRDMRDYCIGSIHEDYLGIEVKK